MDFQMKYYFFDFNDDWEIICFIEFAPIVTIWGVALSKKFNEINLFQCYLDWNNACVEVMECSGVNHRWNRTYSDVLYLYFILSLPEICRYPKIFKELWENWVNFIGKFIAMLRKKGKGDEKQE